MIEPMIEQHSRRSPSVVVTGFGANNHHSTNKSSNPAGILASSLPTCFSSSDPLNPTGRNIEILDAVKGGWAEISASHSVIRDAVRRVHAEHAHDVDLFIHLGRASSFDYFSVERRAFRQDMTCTWLSETAEKQGYYLNPDNEGKYVRDMDFPWANVPMGLQSEVPIENTVHNANAALRELGVKGTGRILEVKPHMEPGHVGCGFTYYESMANCYVQGRQRNVLFCHVPEGVDKTSIDLSRNALLAVIGAAIRALGELEKNGGPEDFKTAFAKLTG